MKLDPQTLAVYNSLAGDYADMVSAAPDVMLDSFVELLPEKAQVLDLGCGPATATTRMIELGHRVKALDPSVEMAAEAKKRFNVDVTIGGFEDVRETDYFDAIWASFSLLHAPREDMPGHLAAFRKALKPKGLLAIGLKSGKGSHRDKIGRLYTYYEPEELSDLLDVAGFSVTGIDTGEGTGLDGSIAPWFHIRAHA